MFDDEDAAAHMANTRSLNTTLAIKEIILWLTCTGQDFNKNNYKIEAETKNWTHAPTSAVFPLVSVPGIGTLQLDTRNQEALIFVSELLNADDAEEFPAHSRDLCRGQYGNRPARFFSGPVYMSGWPSAESTSEGSARKKPRGI